MTEEFVTFKNFSDRETAESFAEVLKEKGLTYKIEEDALVFDPSYANNPLSKDYLLKILPSDFTAATKAYEDYFSRLLDEADKDYYLYSFSDEELRDIVSKPDEWGSFDYLLSQRLLEERGLPVSAEEKESLKANRLKELSKPEKETVSNILGYYLVSLIFFPVGVIIGWVWAYSKKTLPDGRRVYTYDVSVQRHGRIIFKIAIALFLVTLYFRFRGTIPPFE